MIREWLDAAMTRPGVLSGGGWRHPPGSLQWEGSWQETGPFLMERISISLSAGINKAWFPTDLCLVGNC